MKKTLYITLSILLFSACNSGPGANSPQSLVKKASEAQKNQDVQALKVLHLTDDALKVFVDGHARINANTQKFNSIKDKLYVLNDSNRLILSDPVRQVLYAGVEVLMKDYSEYVESEWKTFEESGFAYTVETGTINKPVRAFLFEGRWYLTKEITEKDDFKIKLVEKKMQVSAEIIEELVSKIRPETPEDEVKRILAEVDGKFKKRAIEAEKLAEQ